MDLVKLGDENLDELLQAQSLVWNHTFRFISSMSLNCAVELEIPDIIQNHGQPMTISDLALALHIHPSKVNCLYRLMRILVHSGFFTEHKEINDSYVITPASRLLLKDHPLSARSFVLAMHDPILMKPWDYLSAWFLNDDPTPPTVYATAHGCDMWDHAAHEPRMNLFFNEAMASDSRLTSGVVVNKCKGVFEGLKSLVDVGGGTGTLTKSLAKAFPQMDCTVFDLPHVVAGLQGSQNLKYLGGNMFQKIPPGDAIMLKWILHDWSDEECIKILKGCKEAIGSKEKGGKVIIIDMIMGNQEVDDEETSTVETKLFWDMEMMVIPAGQERNEQEWSKLFAGAGFINYKIHHILGLRSLIELYP